MDRRHSRTTAKRADRATNRKFCGNRFTAEKETEFASTSAAKLARKQDEEILIEQSHRYCIIEFFTVFSTLSQFLICKQCKGNVNFKQISDTGRGLGFKIASTCKCDDVTYINSGPLINNKAYEINRRIVLVMRLLGIGRNGINLFCNLMDICHGLSITTYYTYLENIHVTSKAVFEFIMKKAVDEEKEKNSENGNPLLNLTVSGDGSWKKRGFTSLFGVTTLIGKFSGKVIDLIVKSSYCKSCEYWKNKHGTDEYDEWLQNHEEKCTVNHTGSSGKMEVDSVKEMFSRSMETFGVRYTKYIGDGDSNTFKAILDLNPYGDDFIVKKNECVNHVKKRMGTRLRNIRKNMKLGGKGKLTEKLIEELSKYYGLAIIRNSNSVDDMYNAIWATYFHKCSTNENPQHSHCPKGSESWCKWRRAEAENKLDTYHHDAPLHKDVEIAIKKIYEDLSSKDLLEKCLGGNTQNNNESFNSTIWRLAPKHIYCGVKTIEIAAFLAAGIFNEGFYAIKKCMMLMGINIGPQCENFCQLKDDYRKAHAARRSTEQSKEGRIARKRALETENELYEQEEGLLYGPGIAD